MPSRLSWLCVDQITIVALVFPALFATTLVLAGGHTAPVTGEGLYVLHAGKLLAVPGQAPPSAAGWERWMLWCCAKDATS